MKTITSIYLVYLIGLWTIAVIIASSRRGGLRHTIILVLLPLLPLLFCIAALEQAKGWLRRRRALITLFPRTILVAILLCATGCQQAKDLWNHVNIAPPPPLACHVLIDKSGGPGREESKIWEALNACLQVVSEQPPGSSVSVWMIGDDATTTSLLKTLAMPVTDKKGARAEQANKEKFLADSTASLTPLIKEALSGPPPRHSPLIESLTKVSWSFTPGTKTVVLFTTDGRQNSPSSGLMWECNPAQDPETVMKKTTAQGLLVPGSFCVTIIFTHFNLGPAQGCQQTISNHARLKQVWTELLTNAGSNPVFYAEHFSAADLNHQLNGGK